MRAIVPVVPKDHPVVRIACSPPPVELEGWTLDMCDIDLIRGVFLTDAASPEVMDGVPVVVRDVKSRVGRDVPILVEIADAFLAQIDLDFAGTGSPGGVGIYGGSIVDSEERGVAGRCCMCEQGAQSDNCNI